MARDDRHFHFFSSELFAGTAGSFHLFLIIIPLVSLEPIRFDACQRDRRKPCVQNLAWLLWTTRRGALASVPRTHAGGPSDIPVSSGQIHRRTHAGLGTGVRKSLALSRRRWPATAPLTGPKAYRVPLPVLGAGGVDQYIMLTNPNVVKKKIGIFYLISTDFCKAFVCKELSTIFRQSWDGNWCTADTIPNPIKAPSKFGQLFLEVRRASFR